MSSGKAEKKSWSMPIESKTSTLSPLQSNTLIWLVWVC